MGSITTWRRLEPRPRSRTIARALAAEVRDPAWMLARQWQFGEFRGEDVGSAAYAQVRVRHLPMVAWRPGDRAVRPLEDGAPFEAQALGEPFTPDVATSVEIGQRFEATLREAGLADLVRIFRAAYPLERVLEDDAAARVDHDLQRFLLVCGGRSVNGARLYRDARAGAPGVVPPGVPAGAAGAVSALVEALVSWVQSVFGELAVEDAPAWRPERLEYALHIEAAAADGRSIELSAEPGLDGDLDWFSFDVAQSVRGATSHASAVTVTRSALPAHVRFPGMPHARWWHFEESSTDFGDVRPDKRDLAKLAVVDFMLVHGNDWLVVPIEQPVGSVAQVESVVVVDVFGELHLIEPAGQETASGVHRWSMFTTTDRTRPGGVSDLLVLPPSAGRLTLNGEIVEEVRFIRDEVANMVWAIEHLTENGVGAPWLGRERVQDRAGDTAATVPGATPAVEAPLRYRIQSAVPSNWIPFVPVAVDAARRQVALERAALLAEDGSLRQVTPHGRILRPGAIGNAPYRVREEEVPRSGTRVARHVRRARWIDGSTHLWVTRRKGAGHGEGSSGLRFDLVTRNNGGRIPPT